MDSKKAGIKYLSLEIERYDPDILLGQWMVYKKKWLNLKACFMGGTKKKEET